MASKVTIITPPGFVKTLEGFLDKTAIVSADEIKTIAQNLAPVDTGSLRDSIDVSKENNKIIIGSDLGYSGFVEYGTLRQPPQPFIRSALNRVLDENR